MRLLEQEVHAEVDGVLAEARGRADEIVAAARRAADETVAEARRQVERRRIETHSRAASAAKLRAAALILQTKDEAIRGVLDDAEAAARDALRDPARRRAVLRAFLEEASQALGKGQVTVEVPPDDGPAVVEACGALGMGAEVREGLDVEDGIRVVSADRRAVIENTLTSRLARVRHGLATRVASVLWGSEV